jgi:hypothetical protein
MIVIQLLVPMQVICDYKLLQLILLVKASHPCGKMKEKEEIMILNPLNAYVF